LNAEPPFTVQLAFTPKEAVFAFSATSPYCKVDVASDTEMPLA